MIWIKPITLKGNYVTLVPLSIEHCGNLIEATKDGELWKLWYATVPSPDAFITIIHDDVAINYHYCK